MEQAFRALVQASAPGIPANWGEHPQGTAWPGIVLTAVSNADALTMQGPDGLWIGRVQVDAYALTYKAAKDLAGAVTDTLNGHSGGGFNLIHLLTATDSRESGDPEEARPYRVRMDFRTVWRGRNG